MVKAIKKLLRLLFFFNEIKVSLNFDMNIKLLGIGNPSICERADNHFTNVSPRKNLNFLDITARVLGVALIVFASLLILFIPFLVYIDAYEKAFKNS